MLVIGAVIENNLKKIVVKNTKMTHLISIYANKAAPRPWF